MSGVIGQVALIYTEMKPVMSDVYNCALSSVVYNRNSVSLKVLPNICLKEVMEDLCNLSE